MVSWEVYLFVQNKLATRVDQLLDVPPDHAVRASLVCIVISLRARCTYSNCVIWVVVILDVWCVYRTDLRERGAFVSFVDA